MTMFDAVCTTCGNTYQWHANADPKPQHPFNDGTRSVSEMFGKKLPDGSRTKPGDVMQIQVMEQAWPFDPVLRQALIDKGLLTPDDLRNAESKIRAVTAQFGATGNESS